MELPSAVDLDAVEDDQAVRDRIGNPSTLPDPKAGVEWTNVGFDSFTLGDDEDASLSLTWEQEFFWPGRRRLTGDVMRRDENGFVLFVGRADDIIKTAGHMVGPFEVESVLMAHPSVSEAAVIGKPDEVAGLIIYLCSEEAAFVTGANISINGGQHMY